MESLDEPTHAAAKSATATYAWATTSSVASTSGAATTLGIADRAGGRIRAEDTKARDPDWPVFPKFSGKDTYAGVGADFKSWGGGGFLQRLVAAQQINDGDWPEEFKILALNDKLEGTPLIDLEKMQPG
ncbi:hypothetical protein PC117_g18135 [Phytophthora cactorum]|uniref:Uncharacterized protein n=1 Tax=Phytophthora cactorum TaxID=29920 RepID=A0A8T1C1I9_9STRA|nr:hypothetical protein PC117_g18135 [Phytophthora cactorum]